jgi:uncharacterized protein (DUF1810 family)
MSDPFNLQRFVEAQNSVYTQVCAELKQGVKRSHWMWFIFPQIAGLGHSPMARRFAIGSLAEARAYLEHPILGRRLTECTTLVNRIEGKTAEEIFGYPDDMKFRSSMTLFAYTTSEYEQFEAALQKFFQGVRDPLTLHSSALQQNPHRT